MSCWPGDPEGLEVFDEGCAVLVFVRRREVELFMVVVRRAFFVERRLVDFERAVADVLGRDFVFDDLDADEDVQAWS